MAKNYSQNKNNKTQNNYVKNNKNKNDKKEIENSNLKNNNVEKTFGMKILTFLGVVISCAICIYLMNYFFVEKSYLKINISTDKRVDYIKINGTDTGIITQKYISDLNYTMRYDIDKFKVIKYKNQDIFKYLEAEKVLVIVEKGIRPDNCVTSNNEMYNSCIVNIDDYSKEYYITKDNLTYKITLKTPGPRDYKETIKSRIEFMLDSFTIEKR